MQKKRDYNYVYYFLQLVLLGLTIMFICTYFVEVKATEQFRESGENIKNCLYCLLFSFLPFILRRWNIHSTKTLQVYFLLAIMVHFIGGGTLHYYRDVWYFSFIVHLINSFLIATIIYGMLLRHCKNQSKFFMFLATVAFTALVGVMWEFCEYVIDGMKSGSNMQRFNNSVSGEAFVGRKALQDTMIDLMMDTLGGALAGLYFAFTNIKGVPLYKFLELKYVKADTNISYQEDISHEKLQSAKAEKKALKLELKNNKQKSKIEQHKQKQEYKKQKLKSTTEKSLNKKQKNKKDKAETNIVPDPSNKD